MTAERWALIKEAFLAALPLAPRERQALLAARFGDDRELIGEVESLLQRHIPGGEEADDSGDITETSPTDGHPPNPVGMPTESSSQMIDHYKLLQKLGEGGMGLVYMADQESPVRRKVALKIIKPGMDSALVIARFEAERQALAMMDHPNIARVFDAGTTPGGRPYFVMELVHGIPITQYCDQKRLTPRARLELFIPVCQAIQHAHQKGIIHRDLKPSNVLVATFDGKPLPKVIDFGVAKALYQRLTEKTLFTQFGGVVGTPEYMSPEQTENDMLGTDTRSDIYTLGVMLYELLTGTTPLDIKKLREEGYAKMMQCIREMEPPKPSTRLHDSGKSLAEISASRATEPRKLVRLLAGDLDWIVMKALEKDRSRRYETADGLVRDVQRYLANEAVEARSPSSVYLVRKFLRRHRWGASVAAAAVLTLGLGTGVIWQEQRKTRAAWEQTKAALDQAKNDRDAAESAKELAEKRGKEADKLRQFAEEQSNAAEVERKAADEQRRVAEQQRTLAEDASTRYRRALSNQYVGEGIKAWDADDMPVAALWFAQALKLDQGDQEREHQQRLRLGMTLERCPRMLDIKSPVRFPQAAQTFGGRSLKTNGITVESVSGTPGLVTTLPIRHTGPVNDAIFSSDGRYIATASEDGTARVWDAQSCAPLTPPLNHPEGVRHVRFSPDGKTLVTVCAGIVRIWDIREARTLAVTHGVFVRNAEFSPDGNLLVTTCNDQTVRFWDAHRGTAAGPILPLGEEGVAASFSPQATKVVTLSGYDHVRVWDAASGRSLTPMMIQGDRSAVFGFDPDEEVLGVLVSMNPNEAVTRLWAARSGIHAGVELTHAQRVKSVQLNTEGTQVMTVSGREVRVWDALTGMPACPPMVHPDTVMNAAWNPPSSRVATSNYGENSGHIWDVRQGKRLGAALPHEGLVTGMAWSPNGARILTCSADKTARVWDAATGKPVTGPLQHEGEVLTGNFSPDGKYVITAGGDKTARIWDAETGQLMVPPLIHGNSVLQAFFFPDGRHVVTRDEYEVRIWDAANGQLVKLLKQDGGFTHVDLSSNGKQLVTAGPSAARVWNAVSFEPVTIPLEDAGELEYVNFSLNGERLVTGGGKHVRIWDAITAKPLSPRLELGGYVRQVAYDQGGQFVAACGDDGMTRIWRMPSTALPVEVLEQYAELLAFRHLDNTGALARIDYKIWNELWERLRKETPELFQTTSHAPTTTEPASRPAGALLPGDGNEAMEAAIKRYRVQ